MSVVFNGHVQVLILHLSGQVPTIPDPPTLSPVDDGWLDESDILIGEFAINKEDKKVWTRTSDGLLLLSNQPTEARAFTSTATPTLSNWQASDAAIYGNNPRLRLLEKVSATKYKERLDVGAEFTYSGALLQSVTWDLGIAIEGIILIN